MAFKVPQGLRLSTYPQKNNSHSKVWEFFYKFTKTKKQETMKKETFEKAQELNIKIEDLERAITDIEKNEKHQRTGELPLNLSFCFEAEQEDLKKNVLAILKARKLKYEKQFEALK